MGKTPSTEHLAGILTAAFMAARLRTAPACTNSTSGLAAHAGAATCAPDHRAALGEAARQHRAPTLRRLTAEIEAFDLEHVKGDERGPRTRLAVFQRVEIGLAVRMEGHRLAVQHAVNSDARYCLGDPGKMQSKVIRVP